MGIPGLIESIKGRADGFVTKYADPTHVNITAGIYDVAGKKISLSADANYLFTSLPSGFDIIYIYLNRSASGPTSPSFYNTIVEPVLNPILRGWYHPTNTSDRLVGVVRSPAASATIEYFAMEAISQNYLECDFGRKEQLATDLSPDGTWQTPNTAEFSTVCPVNAVSYKITMDNGDDSDTTGLYCANSEMAAVNTAISHGQFEQFNYSVNTSTTVTTCFLALGASRNIKIAGNDDDLNTLGAWFRGFGYAR